MKAMIAGFAAMIVIAAGAWLVLGELGYSSQEMSMGANVRLN